jgi:eukaryotic-like serine/threonine-protein kinase
VFKFITHRSFWLNLLIIIALTALILWSALQMLGVITKHGEYLTVPGVVNKPTASSIKMLEDKGFTVIVQDSVYTDTAKMGTVLKQFPEANSTVKVNRVIMLTVNRVTLPLVDMPTLTSKSKEYAIEILERSHLKLADTIFKPSYMLGAVIEQQYNGVSVPPGSKIPWGSKILLVVGSGLSNQEFFVPALEGITFAEAKAIIEEKGLLLASTMADAGTVDTANAYVYKQNPPRLNEDKSPNFIRAGQVMDLWVAKERKIITDTLTVDLEDNNKNTKDSKTTNKTDKTKGKND